MTDPSVRSLLNLEHTASTARVLNLLRVWRQEQQRLQADAEGEAPAKPSRDENAHVPLFRNALLDRCLVIKHRLRRGEEDLFAEPRQTATKIVSPIDPLDLKLGGHTLFVGQHHYQSLLTLNFGDELRPGSPDYKLLTILDAIPSLDPFLLREWLRRNGVKPARRYFEISDADMKRMFDFVQREVEQLVNLSMGGAGDGRSSPQTAKLTEKILSNATDKDMEPLRLTLRLAKEQYEEGVFCWKGFLYYKWLLGDIVADVSRILTQIETVKPTGPLDPESKAYIARSREVLKREISRSVQVAMNTLKVYDRAYANLTTHGRPQAFREFLLDAPQLFSELGERLGGVNHIVSFWRFRFREGAKTVVSVEELMDIFRDFESGLSPVVAEVCTTTAPVPTSSGDDMTQNIGFINARMNAA